MPMSTKDWVFASLLYLSLIISVSLMRDLGISEFQFNHRFHTEQMPDNYPLKPFYPDIGVLHEYEDILDTNDNLWKFMSGDSRYYIAQTTNPKYSIAPYRYRILSPFLASSISGLLGTSINQSFTLINIIATFAASVVFTLYLKELGFRKNTTIIGGILFLTMSPTAHTVTYPLLEPTSFFFSALIFYSVLKRNMLLFLIGSCLGIMTKEILLFSSILWLMCNLQIKGGMRHIVGNVLIAVVPVVTFGFLRTILGGSPLEVNYGYNVLSGEFPLTYARRFLSLNGTTELMIKVFLTFNFLWLGLFNLRRNEFILRSSVVIPTVILAAALLSSHIIRVIAIIFPVVIPLFLMFFINSFQKVLPERKPDHPHEDAQVTILGTKVNALGIPRLHEIICNTVQSNQRALILHVNIYGLNLAYQQPWLRQFFRSADIVFCDGAGVILGARILGYRIPQRITYADWMWQLAALAEAHNFTFFLLGARSGIAEKAAHRLREKHPRLRIVGTHHGYFDKASGNIENETVLQLINSAKPNILIVAFGMPLQEQWLMENWHRIDANIALTGGAVFDYISGELRRGPRWMTDNGFEWLARLIIEPRRLWRRYIIGNPLFLWRVLKQRLGLL